MKHYIRCTGTAMMAVATLTAGLVLAEDKSASQKPDPQMEEMMKKAQAAGAPGAAHKALGPLVGNWAAEVKCQKNMTMKQVIRIISPDTHVFEMHDPSKGSHSKTMEITYTRQGSADQQSRSSVAER